MQNKNNTYQTTSKLRLIYFLEGSRSNLLNSRAHMSVNSVQSGSGEQNKKENLIQSSPLIKSIFSYTGRELLCCGANNTPELFNLLKARNNNSHTYGPRNLKETIVIDPRNRCFWMIYRIKETRGQKRCA